MRIVSGRGLWSVTSIVECIVTVIIENSGCGGHCIKIERYAALGVVVYGRRIIVLVMSVYASPAIFTKLNFCFMFLDIPAEKHASSSRMYSLNVALRHRPIFCISLSLYPDSDKALAPPLRKEWVSMRVIGMPFFSG